MAIFDCLNRTIIGLKDKLVSASFKRNVSLNRTIIGLKD